MTYLALAVGVFLAVAGSTAYAQTIDLRANIPFDFRMGDAVMPAGEYHVQSECGVLILRGEDGSHPAAAVITIPVSRPAAQEPSRLEFTRYGNSYFLTEVWDAFSEGGKAPLKTPQEKEYAARNGLVQTASVPAQRK